MVDQVAVDDVALVRQALGQFPQPGVGLVEGAVPTGEAASAARQPGTRSVSSLTASSACAQLAAGPVPSGVQLP